MTRPRDPLAQEITRQLAPIVAPAAEKAELLIEELRAQHPKLPAIAARGVGDAIRKLRARLSEADIRAGADALMARMKREYGMRESVT